MCVFIFQCSTGLPNAKYSDRIDGPTVDFGYYSSKEFLLAVSLASKPGTVHVIIIIKCTLEKVSHDY